MYAALLAFPRRYRIARMTAASYTPMARSSDIRSRAISGPQHKGKRDGTDDRGPRILAPSAMGPLAITVAAIGAIAGW